ncbi:UNVERIFIED_ORG: hypothetical protein GGD58_004921 [Rhizobium pisi]
MDTRVKPEYDGGWGNLCGKKREIRKNPSKMCGWFCVWIA